MKLSTKLILIILLTLVSMSVIAYFTAKGMKNEMIEARKHELQTVLAFTVNQAKYYIDQEQSGQMSREEAEQRVEQLLIGMRYGESFIWANDEHGIARVHVKKNVIGEFQSSYPKYIGELTKSPFAFTVGESTKPNSDQLYIKINGMTLLPEWKWMMGIGIYMDGIDSKITSFMTQLIGIMAVVVVLIGLSLFWAFRSTGKMIGTDPKTVHELMGKVEQEGLYHFMEAPFAKGSVLAMIKDNFEHVKYTLDSLQHVSKTIVHNTDTLSASSQAVHQLVADSVKKNNKVMSHLVGAKQMLSGLLESEWLANSDELKLQVSNIAAQLAEMDVNNDSDDSAEQTMTQVFALLNDVQACLAKMNDALNELQQDADKIDKELEFLDFYGSQF